MTPAPRNLPAPSPTECPLNLEKAGELKPWAPSRGKRRPSVVRKRPRTGKTLTHELEATHVCSAGSAPAEAEVVAVVPPFRLPRPSARPPVSREPPRPLEEAGRHGVLRAGCLPDPPAESVAALQAGAAPPGIVLRPQVGEGEPGRGEVTPGILTEVERPCGTERLKDIGDVVGRRPWTGVQIPASSLLAARP